MTDFARLPAVERRLSGGRSLIHVVNGAKPVELAGSAPVVWELLDIFSDVDELATALNQRYTDEPTVIAEGMWAALNLLRDAGLIVERPSG